mmetsp:Transcript_21806/g.54978  ORF Transcript_21806/g.54978 Transcript_21806/m.54978 type:complete len:254 (-) Transcript_21806:992-1753(-)
MDNFAAVLEKPDDIRFQLLDDREHDSTTRDASRTAPAVLDLSAPPPPGSVLIKVQRVGVCGSDVHYWKHGRIGDFVLEKPMILGHETSGVVVAVGAEDESETSGSGAVDAQLLNSEKLRVGDRVALEPGIPCGVCAVCKTVIDPSAEKGKQRRKYNLCPDVRFFATPPIDGSCRNYLLHPARFCFKLPENVSLEEGALCEPLSVGVYACGPEKGNVKEGDSPPAAGPRGSTNRYARPKKIYGSVRACRRRRPD